MEDSKLLVGSAVADIIRPIATTDHFVKAITGHPHHPGAARIYCDLEFEMVVDSTEISGKTAPEIRAIYKRKRNDALAVIMHALACELGVHIS